MAVDFFIGLNPRIKLPAPDLTKVVARFALSKKKCMFVEILLQKISAVMKNKKQTIKNTKRQPRSAVEILFLQGFMPFLWLALATGIVFAQTLGFDFTRLDDAYYLLDHKEYFSATQNIVNTFVQSVVAEQYRPVLFTSFIADTVLAQGGLWMYHVTNIVAHFLVCCLLLLFFRRLQIPEPYPLLLPLLFAVHPLAAQAVSWIPGRSESIMTALILASLLLYLRYLQSSAFPVLLLHGLCFMAAMLTKETSIIIPVLCLLIVPFMYHKPLLPTLLSAPMYRLYVGWFGVLVLWYILRAAALAKTASMVGLTTANIVGVEALWLNLQTIPELIGKMLLPLVNLSLYPRFSPFSTVLGAVALVLLILGLFFARSSFRTYCAGLCWLLLALLPPLVIRATGIRFDYLEYRAYLPLIGFLLCLSAVISHISARGKQWVPIILLVCIGALAVVCYRVIGYYDGEERFWTGVQQQSPTLAEPYLHLGVVRLNQKNPAGAEIVLRKAVEYDSSLADAYSKLGNAIYQQRPMQGFIECRDLFVRAKTLKPTLLDPHINLIIIHIQQKQPREALRYAREMEKAGLNLNVMRPDVAAVLQQIK